MRRIAAIAFVFAVLVYLAGAFVDGAAGIVKASEARTKAAIEAAQ